MTTSESKGRLFLQNESIRIDSHNESNRIANWNALVPLPLTICCFSKIQIGFTFLVPAHPGSPGQRAVKRVCNSKKHINSFFDVEKTFKNAHSFKDNSNPSI